MKSKAPVNEVQISGRLTRDPVVKEGVGSASLAIFSVAVPVVKGDGTVQPHFLDCSFQLAEPKPEWLAKGKGVHIKGHLMTFRPKVKPGEIHKAPDGRDITPFPKMVIRADDVTPLK